MIRAKFGFSRLEKYYKKDQVIDVSKNVEKDLVASGLAYYDHDSKTKNEMLTKQAEYWHKAKGCCG